MKQPIRFILWSHNKEIQVLASKALVADKLLMQDVQNQIKLRLANMLSDALATKLAKEGLRFTDAELFTEHDALSRATEIGLVLDTFNGQLPIEYVNFAYTHWEEEYNARTKLQNFSIWKLVAWWTKRLLLRAKKEYSPEQIYK